jgi:regulator of chromosome condensation
VAAGIDNCLVVTAKGDLYGWGFSDNYRTGLGSEDTVHQPKRVGAKEFVGCKIRFAGCGGQFSVVAGEYTE